MRDLPDDNLSYPVLIHIGNSSGSGFFLRADRKIYLVTALHVIQENNTLKATNLTLVSYNKDLSIKVPYKLSVDLTKVNIRKKENKDVVLIELFTLTDDAKHFNLISGVTNISGSATNLIWVPKENLKKLSDVLISNEVYILGYPSSIGHPKDNQIELDKPLLRKGIVAGINSTNETIILDCPVYFGNSGGIAIEAERTSITHTKFQIIGVVSQFIPFYDELKSSRYGYSHLNIENSGYSVVVPIDTLLELTTDAPSEVTIKTTTSI